MTCILLAPCQHGAPGLHKLYTVLHSYTQLMLLYIAQKQSLEENCEEVNNFISLAHEILRL